MRGEGVDLAQDTALHLFGSLVGEGHGKDGAIEIGLLLVIAYRIVNIFICELVCLARSGTRTQYLGSHGHLLQMVLY